jgi:hydroxypyruvate reductase
MFTPQQFQTASSRNHPEIGRILAAAFNAVEPGAAVKKYLSENPLPQHKRTFAFGLGKAALAMTRSLADSISLTDSLIITKHASPLTFGPATIILGNHPIPGRDSLAAGQAALEFVSRLSSADLLVCLISGGGSALMTAPVISLEELQIITSALLANGSRIDEINTVRRHLDSLKGGGLAKAANGATIISLILSDVVGDSISAIASGPTAPDPSTIQDARKIVGRIGNPAFENLPFHETLKPDDSFFSRVQNHIIASNRIALQAAKEQAEREGFNAKIINENLQGEACEVGRELAIQFKEEIKKTPRPFCLLAGGETTVTIKGNGKGGRNQELVLGAVNELKNMENTLLISIATDGEDGPTDAAGAAATNETVQKAESLGLNPADFLLRNDAYSFFDKLDDLIRTGPSGTNVNDIVLCFAF